MATGLNRKRVLIIGSLVLLVHGVALWWAPNFWQPQSQIKLMAAPVYARLITPKEPVALPRQSKRPHQPAQAAAPAAAVRNNDVVAVRPVPHTEREQPQKPPAQALPPVAPIIPAPPSAKQELFTPLGEDRPVPLPTEVIATAAPKEEIEPFADASATALATAATAVPSPVANPDALTTPTEQPTALPTPAQAASAAQGQGGLGAGSGAVYQDWPNDTRINLKLKGYYRGDVTGSAHVTWQRQKDQYQAQIALNFGLAGFTMTSQGSVSPDGLNPSIFEETALGRLRSVHFEPDAVTIGNGHRIVRSGLPGGVGAGSFQDSASQFVELAWRFATGRATLAAGSTVGYWLGRPEGLYQYIFDISGPEPLQLPQLGTVSVYHLVPRPIPGLSKDAIYGEIWIAPSLQYLPVKIKMRNEAGIYLDMLVDTVEQSDKSGAAKLSK